MSMGAEERARRLREASAEIDIERVRPARLDHMSWPTADITVEPERPRVRSHEVRSYGRTSLAEWIFLVSGILLCLCWLALILGVLVASVA